MNYSLRFFLTRTHSQGPINLATKCQLWIYLCQTRQGWDISITHFTEKEVRKMTWSLLINTYRIKHCWKRQLSCQWWWAHHCSKVWYFPILSVFLATPQRCWTLEKPFGLSEQQDNIIFARLCSKRSYRMRRGLKGMAGEGITTFPSDSECLEWAKPKLCHTTSVESWTVFSHPCLSQNSDENNVFMKSTWLEGISEEIGRYCDPSLSPSWHRVVCKVSCKGFISWCLGLLLELLHCLQSNGYWPLVERPQQHGVKYSTHGGKYGTHGEKHSTWDKTQHARCCPRSFLLVPQGARQLIFVAVYFLRWHICNRLILHWKRTHHSWQHMATNLSLSS